jgi:hypothetical protein
MPAPDCRRQHIMDNGTAPALTQFIGYGHFVTRMKDNAVFEVVERRRVPHNRNILSDEIRPYPMNCVRAGSVPLSMMC